MAGQRSLPPLELCVVVTARERYATAAAMIERLRRSTRTPFHLVVAVAGAPARRAAEIERAVAGLASVTIVREAGFLQPNAARNRGLAHAREEFVCFIENDCMPRDGCLDEMLAIARGFDDAVIVPTIYEEGRTHGDFWIGIDEAKDGTRLLRRTDALHYGSERVARVVAPETHALLARRATLEKIGPFDESLNSREFIDFGIAAHMAGVPIFLAADAVIHLEFPPPIAADERRNFRIKWSVDLARTSNERVRTRWKLGNMPDSVAYVRLQRHRVSHLEWFAARALFKLRRLLARS